MPAKEASVGKVVEAAVHEVPGYRATFERRLMPGALAIEQAASHRHCMVRMKICDLSPDHAVLPDEIIVP